ncbi:hypothetical protein CVT26_006134 [Gymnopilus dilepis]|uniref:DUF1524 domain-containing protein n=1 Tax=Gymnopilus dilepis TaxID=231916 RepID=A0A409YKJ3_9AGAR|nr:hypothetical protein CVT26_006134 [Gymnopilus dilepis]
MLFSVLALVVTVPAALSTPLSGRALPTPVSGATAREFLSELVVAVDSNTPAYSRDLFKTWDIITGTCDTREVVLMRDGTNVVTNSACSPTSGNWVSPYDGVPTTLASDLDIDHLVPLKEAWLSGARDWTPAQREAFANDLTRPQLVAVTDKYVDFMILILEIEFLILPQRSLNDSKGTFGTRVHVTRKSLLVASPSSPDVAKWLPPLSSYVCTYVRAWVTVKHFYNLTIDTAEQAALKTQLADC